MKKTVIKLFATSQNFRFIYVMMPFKSEELTITPASKKIPFVNQHRFVH
jgi:hypothetical protein